MEEFNEQNKIKCHREHQNQSRWKRRIIENKNSNFEVTQLGVGVGRINKTETSLHGPQAHQKTQPSELVEFQTGEETEKEEKSLFKEIWPRTPQTWDEIWKFKFMRLTDYTITSTQNNFL